MSGLRLAKELEQLTKDPIDGISFESDSDNLFVWKFTIYGLKDTPYEGGIYEGEINFPKTYPFDPPKVRFLTKIFHPNVYDGKSGDGNYNIGDLCISILHKGVDVTSGEHELERWRPIQTVRTIFLSILVLLHEPNPDSAANVDAAKLYREDKKAYCQKIRDDMK
jgi:ubiquitin-protein ligase